MDRYIMILVTFFWAGAFIAGKYSTEQFPVFSLTFFRFLIAAIVIFPILMKKDKQWKAQKGEWKDFFVLGLIGMVGYHVFFFLSLTYTSPVNSSIIGAANPIITTILSYFLVKETVKAKSLFAIGLSFLGVLLVLTGGDLSTLLQWRFNIGDVLMLVGVVCFALYGILSKKVLAKHSAIKVTSYAFLTCVMILVPFVLMEKPWVYLPETNLYGWLSIGYMAVFASVFGYLMQLVSIDKIGATKTSLYINLVPFFSMFLAYFVLGEELSVIKVCAGLMIVGGVYINSRGKENRQEKSKKEIEPVGHVNG